MVFKILVSHPAIALVSELGLIKDSCEPHNDLQPKSFQNQILLLCMCCFTIASEQQDNEILHLPFKAKSCLGSTSGGNEHQDASQDGAQAHSTEENTPCAGAHFNSRNFIAHAECKHLPHLLQFSKSPT